LEDFNVSDHSSDHTTGGLGDKSAGMGDMSSSGESPKIAPEQELSAPPPDDVKPEVPKVEAPRIEPKVELGIPKADVPKVEAEAEAPKVEAPRIAPNKVEAEAPKVDAPRETGKVMIVPPSRNKSWDGATIDQGPAAASNAQASGRFGKRLSAIAAAAVLARDIRPWPRRCG
jgi:hypothetical protein